MFRRLALTLLALAVFVVLAASAGADDAESGRSSQADENTKHHDPVTTILPFPVLKTYRALFPGHQVWQVSQTGKEKDAEFELIIFHPSTSSARGQQIGRAHITTLMNYKLLLKGTGEEKGNDKLDGNWSVVECMYDGENRALPKEGMELIFKNGQIRMMQGAKEVGKGSYTIDPFSNPKTIDISNSSKEYEGKGNLGIYELKNGQLRMAIAVAGDEVRPIDYSSKKGSKHLVAIYKRSGR